MEKNIEYKTCELIGYEPSVIIRMGFFDSGGGSITKVKLDDSSRMLFYWNFWGYGWFHYDELIDEAKPLANQILYKLFGENAYKYT